MTNASSNLLKSGSRLATPFIKNSMTLIERLHDGLGQPFFHLDRHVLLLDDADQRLERSAALRNAVGQIENVLRESNR